MSTPVIHDVVIVGSGPAGYTAAIYTGRANLAPVVLAGALEPGGELMKTTDVENYPGFPAGVQGPELMESFREQAERFGAEVIYDDAESLELDGPVKRVTTSDGEVYLARSVIISTGSAHRLLGVDGEARLSGRGVSYCATCDASFFQDLVVAVVGGGDSAAEEALFLAKFASKVYLIIRGEQMRASKIMADRVRASDKIEIINHTAVAEVLGDTAVTGLRLDHGLTSVLPVQGLFVAIGNDPRTALVDGQLDIDPATHCIAVEGRTSKTNLPGVFAAGDVIDPTYKQAITAAASGCIAAQDVEHYLATIAPVLLEAATA